MQIKIDLNLIYLVKKRNKINSRFWCATLVVAILEKEEEVTCLQPRGFLFRRSSHIERLCVSDLWKENTLLKIEYRDTEAVMWTKM